MLQAYTCAVRSHSPADGIIWTRHTSQRSAQIEIKSRETAGHTNTEVLPDTLGEVIPVADLANAATKAVKPQMAARGR